MMIGEPPQVQLDRRGNTKSPSHKSADLQFARFLEPIREVWIHGEVFAASRLSMIRIMARRKNAATVVA